MAGPCRRFDEFSVVSAGCSPLLLFWLCSYTHILNTGGFTINLFSFSFFHFCCHTMNEYQVVADAWSIKPKCLLPRCCSALYINISTHKLKTMSVLWFQLKLLAKWSLHQSNKRALAQHREACLWRAALPLIPLGFTAVGIHCIALLPPCGF